MTTVEKESESRSDGQRSGLLDRGEVVHRGIVGLSLRDRQNEGQGEDWEGTHHGTGAQQETRCGMSQSCWLNPPMESTVRP